MAGLSPRGEGSSPRHRPYPSPRTQLHRVLTDLSAPELRDYYQRKLTWFEQRERQLQLRIEQATRDHQRHYALQDELRARQNEIADLQSAFSDLQVLLFKEKDRTLRLTAENDRLKLQEFEDRKKIQHLLSLIGPGTPDLTLFLRDPPNRCDPIQDPKLPKPTPTALLDSASVRQLACRLEIDKHLLSLQVTALQAQLTDQTRLSREQIDGLLHDRKIRKQETEGHRVKDAHVIRSLTERLQDCEGQLQVALSEHLKLHQLLRHREMEAAVPTVGGVGGSPRSQSVGSWGYDENRQPPAFRTGSVPAATAKEGSSRHARCSVPRITVTENTGDREVSRGPVQLQEKTCSSCGVSNVKVKALERQVRGLRTELDIQKAKDKRQTKLREAQEREKAKAPPSQDQRMAAMRDRLQDLEKQYNELSCRYKYESESYQSDIEGLKRRLQLTEDNVLKVRSGSTVSIDSRLNQDLLQILQKTTLHSKQISGQLQQIKSQVQVLERELQHQD